VYPPTPVAAAADDVADPLPSIATPDDEAALVSTLEALVSSPCSRNPKAPACFTAATRPAKRTTFTLRV
jgi:hypothetical protein